MKHAIRPNSPGIPISADKAVHGIPYICPICKASVSLKAGNIIGPYFAHLQGMGSPDCENYIYSEHQQFNSEKDFAYETRPKLEMEIQISNFGPPRGWSIHLNLPVNKIREGKIFVSMENRIQTIDLNGNNEIIRKIIIDPQEKPYLIKCIPDNGPLAQLLSPYFEAFNSGSVNSFGPFEKFGNEGARRAVYLKVNCTYALIWRSSSRVQFPSDLIIEELVQKNDWVGILVTLPGKVKYKTQIWLEDFTKLSFKKLNPALIPIWPPLIKIQTAQSTSALKDECIVFSLSGTGDIREYYSTPVSLNFDNEKSPIQFYLSHPNKFLCISSEHKTRLHVSCLKSSTTANVEYNLEIQEFEFPTVTLEAQQIDGSKLFVNIHSLDAYEIFNRVRDGELILSSITFPHGCIGKVYIGEHGIWRDEEYLSESGENSVKKILAKLDQVDLDFLLDFDSLGRLLVPAKARKNKSVTLDPDVKRAVTAYLSVLPTQPKWPKAIARLTDSELIEAFIKCKPIEKSKPIYKSIEKELIQLMKKKG